MSASPTTPAPDPRDANLAAPDPAAEDQSQPFGSTYAVVVGIGRYRDAAIPPLRFAHADALAFRDLLINSERAGLPPENVKLLLDEEATLFGLKDMLSGWLYREAGKDSTVLLYFAGHGDIENDRSGRESDGIAKYLLPWDAVPGNLYASALSTDDFRELVNGLPSRRVAVFLDSCYASGLGDPAGRSGARAGTPKLNPWQRMSEGEGRVVLAAAEPNQRSFENEDVGHGLFTYHLIEALQGAADSDGDGHVTIDEVYRYVQEKVPQSAARLAHGLQKPMLLGAMARDIVLTVDTRRVRAQQEAQKSERERTDKELRARKAFLFKLHDEGQLPDDAYGEAVQILGRPIEQLSPGQLALRGNVVALASAALPVKDYLAIRTGLGGVVLTDKGTGPGTGTKTPVQSPVFCVGCGQRLAPALAFCTRCGRKT